MSYSKIKLNVTDIKRIKTPYDGTNPESKERYQTTARTYIASVKLIDVPSELANWRKMNVRDPKMTSGVAKKIVTSLRDDPETFFFKNRGITIIAREIELGVKTDNSVVNLFFDSPETSGLLDGGHTFQAIQNFVEELKTAGPDKLAELDGHVKLEIIVGLESQDEIVAIVEARNTSTQVADVSLEELNKSFEQIKAVLADKPYANRIAYKEFELAGDEKRKDIDIRDILSYLVCFDTERYPFDSAEQPVFAYSSKTAVVKYFRQNKEKLSKFVPLLPDILELRDKIYSGMPDAYNIQSSGKFGRLTGVYNSSTAKNSRKRDVNLPFSGGKSSYQIPSGFIYPALAAFRAIVSINEDGEAQWSSNPFKTWEELQGKISITVGDKAKDLQNPNKMGKQKDLWTACYNDVLISQLTKRRD